MSVIAALLFAVMLAVSWMGPLTGADVQRFEHRRLARSYALAGDLESLEGGGLPVDWVLETRWDDLGYSVRWAGEEGAPLQLLYGADGDDALVYFDRSTGEGWTYGDNGQRQAYAGQDLEMLREAALDRVRVVTGVPATGHEGAALITERWSRGSPGTLRGILVKKNP